MLDAQSRAELRRVGGGSASDGARRPARHSAENELQGTLSLPERALARKTAP
jgi:hypothetical protein